MMKSTNEIARRHNGAIAILIAAALTTFAPVFSWAASRALPGKTERVWAAAGRRNMQDWLPPSSLCDCRRSQCPRSTTIDEYKTRLTTTAWTRLIDI
jgi:hypothetical protein